MYIMNCKCPNILPQSQECYNQMITLKVPKSLNITMNCGDGERKEWVSVDPCIAGEIWELWQFGIVTTGCCCGHLQDYDPNISVEKLYVDEMEKLGYEHWVNPLSPKNKEFFIPVSIFKIKTHKILLNALKGEIDSYKKMGLLTSKCKHIFNKEDEISRHVDPKCIYCNRLLSEINTESKKETI